MFDCLISLAVSVAGAVARAMAMAMDCMLVLEADRYAAKKLVADIMEFETLWADWFDEGSRVILVESTELVCQYE